MADRDRLRTPAYLTIFLSIAVQVSVIAYYWWDFDSRLSCDWVASWDEWLGCVHSEAHTYILMIEFAFAVWLVAGLAKLLGQFASAYFSIFLPEIVAFGVVWHMVDLLQQQAHDYNAYGELTFEDIVSFMRTTGILLMYVVGPITGAWLLRVYKRIAQQAYPR
jgi:hypothetical protein